MEESNLGEDGKLICEHIAFSAEVMSFLMKNSGFKASCVERYDFFTRDIGEAILTFSNIFYKDFRKIYYQLHKSLQHRERFKEYFAAFPLNKDGRYFYYYLMRISLIYQLAECCYLDNRNEADYRYFEVGRKCISSCPDVFYFQYVGGWSSLHLTASFLARIGRPLKLIMQQNYIKNKNILTFADAVETLRLDLVFGGKIKILNSKAWACLEQLKDAFEENVLKVQSRKKQRPSSSPKLASHNVGTNAEKVIIEYFKHCQLGVQKRAGIAFESTEDSGAQKCPASDEDDLEDSETEAQENMDTKDAGVSRRTETDEAQEHMDGKDTSISERRETDEQPELEWDWVKEFAEAARKLKCQSEELKQTTTAKSNVGDSDGEDDSLASSVEKSDDSDLYKSDRHVESKEESVSASYHHAESKDKNIHASSKSISYVENIFSESCSSKKPIKLETKLSNTPLSKQATLSPKRTANVVIGEASCSRTDESEKAVIGEASCSRTDDSEKAVFEDGDRKPNFVVPQKYMPYVGSLDECKFLYSAKMFPPSKREKLNDPLKKILDAHIINRNCKEMASGDIFVRPPDSSPKEETLVIFVDSSTDDEASEDTYRFLCHFKKTDIDFEGKSYNLRPRERVSDQLCSKELSGTGAQLKKQEARSPVATSKRSRRSNIRSNIVARDEAVYPKYITKLYKKYLPVSIDKFLEALLLDARSDTISDRPSSSMEGTLLLFIVTSGLLAKRKVQIKDKVKRKRILGISLDMPSPELEMLPPYHSSKLDFFVKGRVYDSVGEGVCIVGYFLHSSDTDMEVWLLFPPADKSSNETEYNKEMERVFHLYKKAILSREEFKKINRFRLTVAEHRLEYSCNKIFQSLTG